MYPFDPANKPLYDQYLRAHETGDHSEIDHDQLRGHVQEFMQNAPPEMQQHVFAQYFEQLTPEQRHQFVQQMGQGAQGTVDPTSPQQMAHDFHQAGQQPGLLQKILGMASGQGSSVPGQSGGAGGLLSSPMAKAALVGIAGMAAKHFMSGGRGGGFGGGLVGGQQGDGGWGSDRDERDEGGADRDRADGGDNGGGDGGDSGGGDGGGDS